MFDIDPNELVLTFGVITFVLIFGENRSRNVTVRVCTDGQTHRRKLVLVHNLSHAIALRR